MKRNIKIAALSTASAVSIALTTLAATARAESEVYGPFPVTVKDYRGGKTDSTSYSGQAARHVLSDSLKHLAGQGNGDPNAELQARMLAYFEGKEPGRAILAPVSKGVFKIRQIEIDDLSKGKNLAGKTYKGVVTGWPNNPTGPELVRFWIGKAASADGGLDAAAGYDYPQLISKFLMGAMSYNQAVDNYLDEKLAADNKPNDKPYKDGAPYTGKEHSWDESFGYFGAPAHALTLTPAQVYEIAKRGSKSKKPEDAVALADANGDGEIDLYREMTFGPAYYAAGFDKSGATSYLHDIVRAFLKGRELIAAADGEALSDAERGALREYAAEIGANWEKVLAEATFKYAGSVYKDLQKLQAILDSGGDVSKAFRTYAKHWGELKGFSLALQTGRNNLGETAVRLNRLIGYGPPLPNASQVVDVSQAADYVKGQSKDIGEYLLHMLKIQKLTIDKFGVKARNNDMLSDMASLIEKIGDGASAEND